MLNFASIFAKSSVAITGLCVHPKGKLWNPQTSCITPILIVLVSSSGIQHDQNMLATSSLQNHMVRESRATSRNVSPRCSSVRSLMPYPGAAHPALSGTMFMIMAPLVANLYLVKAFALGLLASCTRSMSPSACTRRIIASSLMSLVPLYSAVPACSSAQLQGLSLSHISCGTCTLPASPRPLLAVSTVSRPLSGLPSWSPVGLMSPVGDTSHGGMFALRAPGALLLDYVPPEEPPSTPLGNALRIR